MKFELSGKFIIGLDIGTATVKAVVAEYQDGRPIIRGVFKEPSGGLRHGAILDLAEISSAIGRLLTDVRRIAKNAPRTIYANVGTPQIRTQNSRGIVAVSRADSEIYQDDIDRAIKASQAVNLSPNRTIVHNITREFIVDGVGDIADPLGLSGNRLEVSALIIDAFAPHVKAVLKVIELAGGRVAGLILNPLAVSRAVLTKTQKDLGAVVIDIGAGTTGVSIYDEGKILNVAIFPVGAANVTNDLAVGLKIPVSAAEQIKLNYGYALSKEVGLKEAVDMSVFVPDSKSQVNRRLIAEIIEARLAEILEFVNNELKLVGKAGQLPGGVVVVGGGSKLPGFTELARQELKLAAQIGCALDQEWGKDESADFGHVFEDPELVTALGLVQTGAEREGWVATDNPSWLKKALRYFST